MWGRILCDQEKDIFSLHAFHSCILALHVLSPFYPALAYLFFRLALLVISRH